jgi:glycosyltransferase involved in cell wall biosynthesis
VKFSTLMPSYNYEHFIGTALRSVLGQTLCSELLVQDAGSVDGTLEVLRTVDDERLSVVSEPDDGQSDALNRAYGRATGDVVSWLNSDEMYLPGAFDVAARVLSRLPDVHVLFGDVVFMNEAGEFMRLVGRIPPSRTILEWQDCYISTCSTFFRRTTRPEIRLDPSLRMVMDWDLFIRWMRSGVRFAYVPIPLGAYRVHSGQVTHREQNGIWSRRVGSRLNPEQVRIRSSLGQPLWRPALLPVLAAGDVGYRMIKNRVGSRQRERRLQDFVGETLEWSDTGPNDALSTLWLRSVNEWRHAGSPVWRDPHTRTALAPSSP